MTSADPQLRPSVPRRSSSLHKLIITRLRPLSFQYVWSAWHTKPNSNDKPTLLVESVPDIAAFYRIFNNVPWESIRLKDSLHFFRVGVKPLWEDKENWHGGCWVIKVRRENGRAVRLWEEICVLCCGGQLQAAVSEEHDHILGLSFSPRLYWAQISIWIKRGGNRRSVELLQDAVLSGLSADLRPLTSADYYFKKHSDHQGWAAAVGQ